MDHIPPPPPGHFPPDSKCGDPNGHLRYKAQSKKKHRFSSDRDEYYVVASVRPGGVRETRLSPATKRLPDEYVQEITEYVRRIEEILCRAIQTRVSRNEDARNPQRGRAKEMDVRFKSPAWDRQPPASFPPQECVSYPMQPDTKPKKRRMDSEQRESQALTVPNPTPGPSIPVIHAAPQTDPSNNSSSSISPQDWPMIGIRVCDAKEWDKWFPEAFKAIQQQGCRLIAKEWIKLIHPKKQSTHPYNGNFPRNQRASPERTRPPYWPADVRHKEPDHIDKDARTKLLIHLLMHTPQQEVTPGDKEGMPIGKEILATDMLQVLVKKKEEFKDKWPIIKTVIWARQNLEVYNDGGIDADCLLSVPSYRESSRQGSSGRKFLSKTKAVVNGVNQGDPDEDEEDDDYDNDSRAGSPTPPASPAGSALTPGESDNEDNARMLNVSFSSTVTPNSSRPSAPILRPKADESMNNHLHLNGLAAEQHLPHLGSVPHHNGMPFNHNGPIHHQQTAVYDRWTATTTSDPPLLEAYSNGLVPPHASVEVLGSSQFEHDIYGSSQSAAINGVLPLMEYDEHQPFDFNYGQVANRNMPYRAMSDMGNDMDPGQDFSLHEQYIQAYAPHPQQSRQ